MTKKFLASVTAPDITITGDPAYPATGTLFRTYQGSPTTYAAGYNASLTPGSGNYFLAHNATSTYINAVTDTNLAVSGSVKLGITATQITCNLPLTVGPLTNVEVSVQSNATTGSAGFSIQNDTSVKGWMFIGGSVYAQSTQRNTLCVYNLGQNISFYSLTGGANTPSGTFDNTGKLTLNYGLKIAGATKAAGQFDTTATAPTNVNRLNYDGYLYATRFYGDGSQLTGIAAGKENDFRLTLTTAVPVTTTDVTAATTIYCCPYKGNQISLYDGAAWVTRSSAQFSLALGTLTSAKPYDVFCYDNAGTPTLEFLVWTNDTTRATALVYQDGVLVKSGATTRRYLGTFYTTATTTTEDSETKRFLWNYYHRARRSLNKTDATASWTYTTATVRQARADTANQVEVLLGVAEDCVDLQVLGLFSNTAAGVPIFNTIGLDSTTTESTQTRRNTMTTAVANYYCPTTAVYRANPGLGRHYFAWLEYSTVGGTTTFYGGTTSGLTGSVMS